MLLYGKYLFSCSESWFRLCARLWLSCLSLCASDQLWLSCLSLCSSDRLCVSLVESDRLYLAIGARIWSSPSAPMCLRAANGFLWWCSWGCPISCLWFLIVVELTVKLNWDWPVRCTSIRLLPSKLKSVCTHTVEDAALTAGGARCWTAWLRRKQMSSFLE